jgi:hypothetical protein
LPGRKSNELIYWWGFYDSHRIHPTTIRPSSLMLKFILQGTQLQPLFCDLNRTRLINHSNLSEVASILNAGGGFEKIN